MNIETHNISLSFDQPDTALDSLLTILQQILNQSKLGKTKGIPDHRNILIIDVQEERAQRIAHFLAKVGYRCIVMATVLDAFTRFLRSPFVPFAMILGQDDSSNRLFLHRFLQQTVQKYEWQIPLIRLHLRSPETSLPQVSRRETLQMSSPLHARLEENLAEKGETEKISLEGQNLGRYNVVSLLGDQPHGHVYRTYDRLREQHVALKAIQTSSIPYHLMERSREDVNPFQQEGELLRPLNHPHVLPVWGHGKSYISGTPFIYKTMPYCAEGSLAQWLERHGDPKLFAPHEVGHLILQVANALQSAHDHQITFQNFKLSNILIQNKTEDMLHLHVLLTDFAIPQDGTFSSGAPEALAYVAPERWNGYVQPASDQYGLAAIAYELLTGRTPFQRSAEHVMKLLHVNMLPQPPSVFNPSLSSAVDKVVLRGLAKKPEERFASVALFANTFQRYCYQS